MFVTTYKAICHALSRYATRIYFIHQERIPRFIKVLRSCLRILALQITAFAKSFQEVVDFVIELERVKLDDFTKVPMFKKFHKGGEFSGSLSKVQSSGGYPPFPIQSSL